MKAWNWLKENVTLVLAGLVTLLAGFLAWGAYERKVGRLKDNIKVEKARGEVAALEARRDMHIGAEADLADADARLEAKDSDLEVAINKARREAVAASEEVEGRTDAEVAARFNELYPRSGR